MLEPPFGIRPELQTLELFSIHAQKDETKLRFGNVQTGIDMPGAKV
jgi:hypothetical protein